MAAPGATAPGRQRFLRALGRAVRRTIGGLLLLLAFLGLAGYLVKQWPALVAVPWSTLADLAVYLLVSVFVALVGCGFLLWE